MTELQFPTEEELFGRRIILSWLFSRNSRYRRNSENRVEVTVL